MRRIYAALALVFALLLAQLGSLGHAFSHYAPAEDKERPHSVCQLCVAYAALDHGVAATGSPTPLTQVHLDSGGRSLLGRHHVPAVYYLSRAPPRLTA